MNIIQKPSPNYSQGRAGQKPEAIVIHVMAGTLAGTDSWFATADSQVSAHYGIGDTGEIHQYVAELNTAWHAGQIVQPTHWDFLGKSQSINPNTYTIGIEHEGQPGDVWPEAKKAASAALIRDICIRYNIPIDREHIIGHYQIKASKPNCPAIDKGIIDELIARASFAPTPSPTQPDTGDKISQAKSLLTQALALLS